MEERGAHELARRVRGTYEQILAYGIGTGKADRNIALDLRGTLEAFKRGHLCRFWCRRTPWILSKLEKNEVCLYPQTIRATKLLMLTFVRTSELINATWDELILKRKFGISQPNAWKKADPTLFPITVAIALLMNKRKTPISFKTPMFSPAR